MERGMIGDGIYLNLQLGFMNNSGPRNPGLGDLTELEIAQAYFLPAFFAAQ